MVRRARYISTYAVCKIYEHLGRPRCRHDPKTSVRQNFKHILHIELNMNISTIAYLYTTIQNFNNIVGGLGRHYHSQATPSRRRRRGARVATTKLPTPLSPSPSPFDPGAAWTRPRPTPKDFDKSLRRPGGGTAVSPHTAHSHRRRGVREAGTSPSLTGILDR